MTDITITLTGQEAVHLVLALGFLLAPDAGPLFSPPTTQLLAGVRDRLLQAQGEKGAASVRRQS